MVLIGEQPKIAGIGTDGRRDSSSRAGQKPTFIFRMGIWVVGFWVIHGFYWVFHISSFLENLEVSFP